MHPAIHPLLAIRFLLFLGCLASLTTGSIIYLVGAPSVGIIPIAIAAPTLCLLAVSAQIPMRQGDTTTQRG